MKVSIANIGHQTSAYIESMLHARTKSAARARYYGAIALTGVFLTLSGDAVAASLQTYSTDASQKTNVVVDILTYVSYIGGAILAGLGVVDLKKHVENPGQTPMKNGIAKLGFGGMLLGLPYFTSVMRGTTGGTGGNATLQSWTSKPTI